MGPCIGPSGPPLELLLTTARSWWAERRGRYNLALVLAGIAAFVSYVVALETRCRGVPGVEITIFSAAFQAMGYVVAMMIANAFYSLGAIVERRVGQRNVVRYRHYAYWFGLCFSVALPLTVPALVWVLGCKPGPA